MNESRDAKLPCTAWRTRSCAAAALAATPQHHPRSPSARWDAAASSRHCQAARLQHRCSTAIRACMRRQSAACAPLAAHARERSNSCSSCADSRLVRRALQVPAALAAARCRASASCCAIFPLATGYAAGQSRAAHRSASMASSSKPASSASQPLRYAASAAAGSAAALPPSSASSLSSSLAPPSPRAGCASQAARDSDAPAASRSLPPPPALSAGAGTASLRHTSRQSSPAFGRPSGVSARAHKKRRKRGAPSRHHTALRQAASPALRATHRRAPAAAQAAAREAAAPPFAGARQPRRARALRPAPQPPAQRRSGRTWRPPDTPWSARRDCCCALPRHHAAKGARSSLSRAPATPKGARSCP